MISDRVEDLCDAAYLLAGEDVLEYDWDCPRCRAEGGPNTRCTHRGDIDAESIWDEAHVEHRLLSRARVAAPTPSEMRLAKAEYCRCLANFVESAA